MERSAATVVFIVLLAATIVVVDVLFFRSRFWERLMANVGIVLLYCAFYLRLLNR